MANIDIKKNLKNLGWTLSALAKELGTSQPNITQQLSRGTISLERLNAIAGIVGCSVADLVAEDNNAPSEIKVSINGQEHIYELKK